MCVLLLLSAAAAKSNNVAILLALFGKQRKQTKELPEPHIHIELKQLIDWRQRECVCGRKGVRWGGRPCLCLPCSSSAINGVN